MAAKRRYTVQFSASAQADIANILAWSRKRFGPTQVLEYARTLASAAKSLNRGAGTAGAKFRPEIAPHLWTLHVARGGRRGRHFIVFRLDEEAATVEVLRIFHDAMDLARQSVTGA
jgi:toxin ParE1/3/4